MNFIGLGIACIAMAIAALSEDLAVSKAMESSGRNPNPAKDVRTTMLNGAGLIESISIYILVVAILMAFVI